MSKVSLLFLVAAVCLVAVSAVKNCYMCQASDKDSCGTQSSTPCFKKGSCFMLTATFEGQSEVTYVRGCSLDTKDEVCDRIKKNENVQSLDSCTSCDQDNCNSDKFE
ncbi:uncharacterized protein LOC126748023 [Anthonomus grandis grandis]|uniref:uncharacterized protein LOC126748023 n=1 Tax=Anthonomus grandis grandis TaxID=2921223 RepID=UPI002165DF0A|nr:uncharacterized protein LOC126748023 [Anthonomus grandis grandis]